jgi:hypothetical protein
MAQKFFENRAEQQNRHREAEGRSVEAKPSGNQSHPRGATRMSAFSGNPGVVYECVDLP